MRYSPRKNATCIFQDGLPAWKLAMASMMLAVFFALIPESSKKSRMRSFSSDTKLTTLLKTTV